MNKIRLIAKKKPVTWLRAFALMLHSVKTPIMSDEDKDLIDDIVSMLREKSKGKEFTDEDIKEFKAIARLMQKHEALNKYERLKFVSTEIQLTRIDYYTTR